MNRLEDLLRATQEDQADRAVPADRIRAALPGLARARRRRQRWGAAGAVVAAVIAVTVPVVVVHRSASPVVDSPASCPTIPPRDPKAIFPEQHEPTIYTAFPGFRPAWLPAGYTEQTRLPGFLVGGQPLGPTRTWTKPVGTGPEIDLATRPIATGSASALDRGGKPVDINGRTGYYRSSLGGHTSSVDWAADEPPVVHTVSAARSDLPERDLLRVARSVRFDANAPSAAAIGFRVVVCGLPAHPSQILNGNLGLDGTGHYSTNYLDVWKGDGSISLYLSGKAQVPVAGDPFQLAGHPARRRVSADGRTTYLLVDLSYGRYLTLVGDGFGYDDLARIVRATQFY